MDELLTIRLTGTLETMSPLCIVPPGAEEVNRDGSKYKRVALRTVYEEGMRVTKPVLPGATLRGRIRRSAVEVVRGLAGDRIPLAEWHQNAVGGIKGSEAENGHDAVMRARLRQKNPILALFGAGSPWMISRASIGDAIPQGQVITDIIGGVRADDGRRDHAFFEKLDESAPDDWLSLVDANAVRTRMKKEDRDLKAGLRAARKNKDAGEVARLEAELKALTERMEEQKTLASNPVSMPIQHEAVPAGVMMDQRITLTGVTPAEAGLFFAALNHYLKEKPHLGQHESTGYGLIRGECDVFISSANSGDPFSVAPSDAVAAGTMVMEPVAGLSGVPAQIIDCMNSFREQFEQGAFDFRLAAEVVDGAA